MKAKLSIFTIIIFSFLVVTTSCGNKDKLPETLKPGTYTVEKIIHTITNESKSRGIKPGNNDFDDKYDPNYIYLNIIGSEKAVYIPLFTINCDTNKECQCFRYRIQILEDGRAFVTALDRDGTPVTIDNNNENVTYPVEIPSGAECYFSSHKGNVWELKDDQIYPDKDKVFLSTKHTLYRRDDDVNNEIYRSEKNFSVQDLTESIETLYMERACAGFTVVGILYDSKEMSSMEWGTVTLEEKEFIEYMSSEPSKWYIKIYAGGQSFPSKYNIGTKKADESNKYNYGYYSTGEFSSTEKNNLFKQFSQQYVGYGRFSSVNSKR